MFDANTPPHTLDHNSTQLGQDPIERLRRQAKQRFIGAAVLVLLAIGALPLLLDSQPRPIASTVAIDIPKMDSKQESATSASVSHAAPTVAAATAPITPFVPDQSPVENAQTAQTDKPTAPAARPTEPTKPPLTFTPATDGQRAQALRNDTTAKTTATAAVNTADAALTTKSKYVVQAGSFSDPEKLQSTISKLDKAGIKHYTQAAVGKDGTPRTRLRLKASFATKEEASAAAGQVAKLGIPVIVLKP